FNASDQRLKYGIEIGHVLDVKNLPAGLIHYLANIHESRNHAGVQSRLWRVVSRYFQVVESGIGSGRFGYDVTCPLSACVCADVIADQNDYAAALCTGHEKVLGRGKDAIVYVSCSASLE